MSARRWNGVRLDVNSDVRTIPDVRRDRIRVFRSWDEVAPLQRQWADLLADSTMDNVFLTYDWMESWWIAYRKNRDLFVVGLYDSGGALLGIVPLYRIGLASDPRLNRLVRALRFLGTGTGGTTTSLGLILRRGSEAEGTRLFVNWLEESRREWDVLDLHLMPGDSAITAVLQNELKRLGWSVQHQTIPHLLVPLPASHEEYWRSLSRGMRKELSRKERRLLEKCQVDLHKVRSKAELDAAVEILFELNRRRWQSRGGGGSFAAAEKRVFCREMARRFLERGWLDLWWLTIHGRPAAAELGLRYRDRYHSLWVGMDPDFQDHSVGTVLTYWLIRETIRDGICWFDFLQDAEPYKLRWGVETRSYCSLQCALPWSPGWFYLRGRCWNQLLRTRLRALTARWRQLVWGGCAGWTETPLAGY